MKKQAIQSNEQGLVSIIVVVVMMTIITFITLSFSGVVRNEQRQSLDRQLSTQASYAAESGVNYAKAEIEEGVKNGQSITSLKKDYCGQNTSTSLPYGDYPGLQNSETGAQLTCLLVDSSPLELVYQLSPAAPAKVFPVFPAAAGMTRVQIKWTPEESVGSFNSCPNSAFQADRLEAAGSYGCNFGVLRTDLANTSAGYTREALAYNTFSGLIMPVQYGNSGSASFTGDAGKNPFPTPPLTLGNGGAQGKRYPASCTMNECTMIIDLGGLSLSKYYMRIGTIYRATTVTIRGLDATGNPVPLSDAQVSIDSTAKAQDVLKRVQVRVPLVNNGIHGDYGVQSSQGICKQFTAFPGRSNTTPGC